MKNLLNLLPAIMASITAMATEGALNGRFTINENGDQVVFSQGNLQYQASTDTWRFAENQIDYIGLDNQNISSSYTGWIDLFGWATSGYDNTKNDPLAINFQPWATSTTSYMFKVTIPGTEIDSINCEMMHITGKCDTVWTGDVTFATTVSNIYCYGPSTCMEDKDLVGTSANYDWGVYNAIINGGNQNEMWRTLTEFEWKYIINSRPFAQYLRSRATVCGVQGYILLPDNFTKIDGVEWNCSENYSSNVYDTYTWNIMENAGAVFLPAAGERVGKTVYSDLVGTCGYYWSSSYGGHKGAANAIRWGTNMSLMVFGASRYEGYSVRLVQDVKNESETPTAISNIDDTLLSHKYIRNGQLLILRDDKTYTIQGQETR